MGLLEDFRDRKDTPDANGAPLRETLVAWPDAVVSGQRLGLALRRFGEDPAAWDAVRREHLRLLVGPYHVPAPPYESAYRSPERLVMQAPTIAVRRAYQEAGFSVQREGEIPDDHLACELEFAGLLLAKASLDLALREASEATRRYERFLSEHLLAWVVEWGADIASAEPGGVFVSVAEFLVAFLRSELEMARAARPASAL